MTENTDEIVQSVVKKRRTREDFQVHTNAGDNAKYIKHNMTLMKMSDVDITDKNAVEDRISQYFDLCYQNDMKPSVEGLALAFGTNRIQLLRYANGVVKKVPTEVSITLKKAYATLNAQMADYMQNGKINPVAGIFLMKNNMSYKDETEVVITPNQPLGEIQEAEVIADKYKLLPADDN